MKNISGLIRDFFIAKALRKRGWRRSENWLIERKRDGKLFAPGSAQNLAYAMRGLFAKGRCDSYHFFKVREWQGLLVASRKVFWIPKGASDFRLLYKAPRFDLPPWPEHVECRKIDEALAAAAREGGDVKQAPAESPQSGPEGATPKMEATMTNARELLEGTTPGPWEYRPREYDDWGYVRCQPEDTSDPDSFKSIGGIICQVRDPLKLDEDILAQHRAAKTDPWEANARLVAAAPDLARQVTQLEAQLAEMREALGKVQSYHKGEKPYDFHRLPDDQRQNEAFDAWQVIACEIDALLTKEPK